MTPTEAEAAARDAQERYAMLLAMIEYGKAERARYERQMACVRPKPEDDSEDGQQAE